MKIEDTIFCHTWISTNTDICNGPVCLIHNGLNIPEQDLTKFSIIIDIFNKDLLPAARERGKSYKAAQFLQQKLWIQKKGGGWDFGAEP
jgi:hypothetical protein